MSKKSPSENVVSAWQPVYNHRSKKIGRVRRVSGPFEAYQQWEVEGLSGVTFEDWFDAHSWLAEQQGVRYQVKTELSHRYWDGTEMWDSHATRAANLAVAEADLVTGADTVPPTVWLPQREPYNPGGSEWGENQPADVEIWTYAYDLGGLLSVTLKYRTDLDGENPIASVQNETYAGGAQVTSWQSLPMSGLLIPAETDPMPTYQALRYSATIAGLADTLVDYYVEAVDSLDNVARSPIQHVWIGGSSPGQEAAYWEPETPIAGDTVAVYYDPVAGALPDGTDPVYIHIGHSGWQDVLSPDPQMVYQAGIGFWKYTYSIPEIASSVDFVLTDGLGNWDNNGGGDWHVPVAGGSSPWVMDGSIDPGAEQIALSGGEGLWVGWNAPYLYLATQAASSGSDRFVFLADTPGALGPAPWAKAGQVAAWSAYLANEGENGYHAWYDAAGSRDAAAGTYLEGFLNLEEEFSLLPDAIYLAVGIYQTPDGGALTAQVPEGNGNGNLEADEWVLYPLGLAEVAMSDGGFGTDATLILRSFPNPSRGTATVEILGARSPVELTIFDVRGRLIRSGRLHGQTEPARFYWDGTDLTGRPVAPGAYWLRARAEGRQTTTTILLVR